MIALVPSPSIDEVLGAVAEFADVDRATMIHAELFERELTEARATAAGAIESLCDYRPKLCAIAKALGRKRAQNAAYLLGKWHSRPCAQRFEATLSVAELILRRRAAGRGSTTCPMCGAHRTQGAES